MLSTGRAETEVFSQCVMMSELLKVEYHCYGCGVEICSLMGTSWICLDCFFSLLSIVVIVRVCFSTLVSLNTGFNLGHAISTKSSEQEGLS